jgi:crossover junction endodeoxyribonuclease RuvC
MTRHALPSLLCLDLATTTGWALSMQGKVVSGSMNFKPSRWEGGGMRFLRFRREFLDKMIGVREVYYEEVRRHLGVDAAHVYDR